VTRLLLVTNDYPPKAGGIQQYLGNLVRHIDAEVMVLAPHDADATDDPMVVRSDKTYMLPTSDIAAWATDHAMAFDPDYILFGAPHPLPHLIRRLRTALDVPIGILCHGAEVTLPAAVPGVRRLLAGSLRAADARFAVSEYTARRVERLTGEEVVFVGAGVDIDAFRPPREAVDNRPPIVGCVSRFVPRKGQHRLIEAASQLGREVELLFVGTGRTEVKLRTMAVDRAVRTRFEIGVAWERLPELYAEMDVFCMPSTSRWGGLEIEGLGLVYLEAEACGVPVLAGDSGGAPETVIPGVTGFVVHDVADIVEGLRILLSDPDRARRMGAAARRVVEERWTWPQVTDRFLAGFEDVR